MVQPGRRGVRAGEAAGPAGGGCPPGGGAGGGPAGGYASSQAFPLSVLTDWRGDGVRYLRTSLLGVVDAHSGETQVYLVDDPDPLSAAWAGLAPDIVRPAGG